MKKIKLNKQKLNEKWEEGGRVASRWCNYYLVEKDDNHYLIEVANWKAYLVSLAFLYALKAFSTVVYEPK